MTTDLKSDLKRLSRLAYHRWEWGQGLVRRIRRLPKAASRHPDYHLLETIYRWLFVPITLWPVDLEGVGGCVVSRIEAGRPVDKKMRLLLTLLGEPPSHSVQAVVAEHEHEVQAGHYESLLRSHYKYDAVELLLSERSDFRDEWDSIKAAFDVNKFRDHKKIIRRRMVQERNFRNYFHFGWSSSAAQFYELFDVFCHRWNLYGMQKDRPLLLKLTVNLTPFGTIIFIPAYWSFDPKRDLKWGTITALHRARGVARQGPKLSPNQAIRREEGEKAVRLWHQATTAGKKGDARVYWVMGKLGWDLRTDRSRLSRLLQERRRCLARLEGNTG